MEQCESCFHYYKTGINGSTLVWEKWEYKLCYYCMSTFNEDKHRQEYY